jgi:hypothetical protein
MKWYAWFRSQNGEILQVQSDRVFEKFPEFLENYKHEVLQELGQVA